MGGALLRIGGYVLVALFPAFLAAVAGAASMDALTEIGKSFALIGIALLVLQVVVAARIRWIEKAFGLDVLLRFHKHMAALALGMILLHPLLLALGAYGWPLFFELSQPWPIWVGKIGLGFLFLQLGLSLFQRRLKLSFERWRLLHDGVGPVLLGLAFVHAGFEGSDFEAAPMQILWVAGLAAAVGLFVHHRFLRPVLLGRRPYRVVEVKPEVEGVWTVTLAPPEGAKVEPYLPGQFHFLTFRRGKGLPVEEHHWTIASSPTERGHLRSTIKNLGDFTATMGETREGDTAVVHGPFGRFSHVLHPKETDLVFLAGGIGITPLMSMLRHMRDTGSENAVTLLYANKTEAGIAFRAELEEIERGDAPRLKLVHVLSDPGGGWDGEGGFVDRDKIEKHCGKDPAGKTFYVCGPPPMLDASLAALRAMGVLDRRIRIEIFSLLD